MRDTKEWDLSPDIYMGNRKSEPDVIKLNAASERVKTEINKGMVSTENTTASTRKFEQSELIQRVMGSSVSLTVALTDAGGNAESVLSDLKKMSAAEFVEILARNSIHYVYKGTRG